MPDFTLHTYKKLLETLLSKNYSFQTFAQYLKEPAHRSVILRHDVDAKKLNSLQTARLEYDMGITGTYYFRMVPESFDEDVIMQIHELGHEIGYHYEDVSACAARGNIPRYFKPGLQNRRIAESQNNDISEVLATIAIKSFEENLKTLRRIAPVETICMHGSPLSRRDNRLLWKYYDYRDFGIIGEPYFDLDFNKLLYLTDTGRRWDGESVSVRDKAPDSGLRAPGKEHIIDVDTKIPVTSSSPQPETLNLNRGEAELAEGKPETRKPPSLRLRWAKPGTRNQEPGTPSLRTSFDIIRAANSNTLPDSIMLTIHPQRWTNKPLPWLRELIWQNIKNIAKGMIVTSTNRKG